MAAKPGTFACRRIAHECASANAWRRFFGEERDACVLGLLRFAISALLFLQRPAADPRVSARRLLRGLLSHADDPGGMAAESRGISRCCSALQALAALCAFFGILAA